MESTARQRAAIIDLGSNSARVIIMNFVPGYSYHLEDEIREITRLQEGMTERGLSDKAVRRAMATLRLFKRFSESVGAETIIATATSAVREAANGKAFVDKVRAEIGLELRVLERETEAYYGVLGVLNGTSTREGVVVDIGGGSVQISDVTNRRFSRGQSLPLGALALTERFIHSDPVSRAEQKQLREEIERRLDEVPWLEKATAPLTGLGGTVRTVAKIEAARVNFPLATVNGMTISRASVDETAHQLSELPLAQRDRIRGLKRDRADIILPGVMVIQAVMDRLNTGELHIASTGLREGLFFEHFLSDRPNPVIPRLREFSVANMGRFYGYNARHAHHVRYLAGRLFEQLIPLHGYGPDEHELLGAAALLHDIGTAVNYHDHHKYSQILITSAGLPGFTPRETAIVSLLARYHRKGRPVAGDYATLLMEGDAERITLLSAILRVAEYLERGRSALVEDVLIGMDEDQLLLTLVAQEYPAVELWDTQRNAIDLLESAVGRTVRLYSVVR